MINSVLSSRRVVRSVWNLGFCCVEGLDLLAQLQGAGFSGAFFECPVTV